VHCLGDCWVGLVGSGRFCLAMIAGLIFFREELLIFWFGVWVGNFGCMAVGGDGALAPLVVCIRALGFWCVRVFPSAEGWLLLLCRTSAVGAGGMAALPVVSAGHSFPSAWAPAFGVGLYGCVFFCWLFSGVVVVEVEDCWCGIV